MTLLLGLNGTKHEPSSSTLVLANVNLPYSQELQTGRLLDFLASLFKNSDKKALRKKLNSRLSSRTRPGFYVEIRPDLHLAYADQRNGHGSQHWWRLLFAEKWKPGIEQSLNSTALTTSRTNSNKKYPLIEWGGMYFRSQTEIKIAEELYNRNILFFGNVRGQVGCQGSPAADGSEQLTGPIEVDFLVFHQGKCMILEVDGPQYQGKVQTSGDYVRDRVLLREGVPTVRFTADECFKRPADVVTEFLNIFQTRTAHLG